jgi:hypothetical protein
MGNVVFWLIAWGVSSAVAADAFAWWVQQATEKRAARVAWVVTVRPEPDRRRPWQETRAE